MQRKGYEPRVILEEARNGEKTWRELAREIGGVSPALLWKVVHEGVESKKVERALGLRPRHYRRAAYFGKGKEARVLAERWDDIAKKWGGLTGLVRGILSGKYEVRECGNEMD